MPSRSSRATKSPSRLHCDARRTGPPAGEHPCCARVGSGDRAGRERRRDRRTTRSRHRDRRSGRALLQLRAPGPAPLGQPRELGDSAVDLTVLPRCSAHELSMSAVRSARPIRRRTCPMDDSWSSTRQQLVWVPATLVWMHLEALTSSERLTVPISTGCAAHTDAAQALLNAVCEVVERDSIALTWLQRLQLPEIDLADAPRAVKAAVAAANSTGRVHRFFDATTDLGVPTVYCVDTDRSSETLRHVVMCSTELDPARAIVKIVREIASSRIALEHAGPVPDSIDDFTSVTDGARFMGHPDRADEFSFLLENGRPTRRFSELQNLDAVTAELPERRRAETPRCRLRGAQCRPEHSGGPSGRPDRGAGHHPHAHAVVLRSPREVLGPSAALRRPDPLRSGRARRTGPQPVPPALRLRQDLRCCKRTSWVTGRSSLRSEGERVPTRSPRRPTVEPSSTRRTGHQHEPVSSSPPPGTELPRSTSMQPPEARDRPGSPCNSKRAACASVR